MIYLPFCIHNHQPAGNFDFVLEDAYQKAYWPFLELLHEFPSIKMTIHNTGFLLDWIVKSHPEYIELLSIMVKRGQVEVMGGGYFEPILAVIPDIDRVAQIEMMSERIEELFGEKPRGLWLAERVWEPTLPTSLNKAGVEYVLVDDFHFIKAGLTSEELRGYYITEDRGCTIKIFPGSEALRYLIPFRGVEELETYLLGLNDNLSAGNAAIYGDDGEKFGVWPGTNKLVFKEGWLKRFFQMIVEAEGVKSVSLGEYAAAEKPLGRVYLPTCSYMEMGEWSLRPTAAREYCRINDSLEGKRDKEAVKRFIQGGTWRGFFSKYPESNWMHKRMLMASRLLEGKRIEEALPVETIEKASRRLYMSQCNDAYWHGIFGGLYLPHLRTEVYRNIIECETILRAGDGQLPYVESSDVDADGLDEVIISSGDSRLFIAPQQGGEAFELDSGELAVNAMNVLTRWPEAYHYKIEALGDESESNGVQSIHGAVKSKEKNIKRFLIKDKIRRGSLVDHIIPRGDNAEAFSKGTLKEAVVFADAPYESRVHGDGVVLSRTAAAGTEKISITKEVRSDAKGGFTVSSAISNVKSPHFTGCSYGLEFNILLPGCDGPRSCLEVRGASGSLVKEGLKSSHVFENISALSIVDGFTAAAFSLSLKNPARVWSFPIYTVTLSEAGFERCFQGTSIMVLFPLGLTEDGEDVFGVEFSLNKRNS